MVVLILSTNCSCETDPQQIQPHFYSYGSLSIDVSGSCTKSQWPVYANSLPSAEPSNPHPLTKLVLATKLIEIFTFLSCYLQVSGCPFTFQPSTQTMSSIKDISSLSVWSIPYHSSHPADLQYIARSLNFATYPAHLKFGNAPCCQSHSLPWHTASAFTAVHCYPQSLFLHHAPYGRATTSCFSRAEAQSWMPNMHV